MSAPLKVLSLSSSILPLLTALPALGSISVSIYLPSLPSLTLSLHASAALVKLSLTVFLFVFAVSQLGYGPLSDRFGRKPPIMGGLIVYLAGSIACACAFNAPMLIGARAIQGVGAAAGPALGRAVLRDLYSGDRLSGSLATVAAAVALSPMLGPVLGGYLQVLFGWRSCFILLTVIGAALCVVTFRFLPETNTHTASDGLRLPVIFRNYATLLSDQEYVAALLCGGMLTAGNFAWTAGAPFVFGGIYHFSPDRYGNVALLVGAGYVLGTVLSGRLSKRFSLFASVALNVIAMGTPSYLWIVFLMVLFTAGMGIVIPMSAACALSRHPEIAGAAAGLLGAMQIVTGAFGTLAISAVGSPTTGPIAIILAVTSVLSLIAAYVALLPFRNRLVSMQGRLA
jgi:DHA1 family bicyclomycin/chloramphenicol resistance-like MFS transporter